jgi:hypothetical protein
MSTPSATARYVIAADDKSASAIRSVIKNFKDMDRDVRGVVKTLNSVLGVFIGVQLTQSFRKVIDATASASAGSSGFARSLREVKDAASDLLVAKTGLPEATKNMNELRDVLKDPSVKAGVDAVVSAMIAGFSKGAKFVGEIVGGLREISKSGDLAAAKTRGDTVEAINKQISDRQKQIGQAAGRGVYDLSGFSSGVQDAEIKRLQAEIETLKGQQTKTLDTSFAQISGGRAGHGAIPVTSDEVQRSVLGDRLIRQEDERHEAFMKNINQEIAAYNVSIVGHEQNTKAILTETQRYLDQQVAIQDLEEIDLNAIEAKKTFVKSISDDIKALDEIMKEAARGMYNAWEQFFFDPFKGGLKGLALGILDVIRHAVAAQAALAIMKSLSNYGSKTGGVIGTIASVLGGSFGGGKAEGGPLQSGKWYIAGEKGPEPIWGGGAGAFAMGYGGGGPSITINQYMDNRGATQDLIAQLPAFTKANNAALKADILDTLARQRRRG